MGKTTQSTTQSSSPPPQVLQNYQDLVSRATNVANTPFQQYPGYIVQGTTGDQTTAMQNMDNLYGLTTPYINQAAQYTQAAANPIGLSAAQTSALTSPYSQSGAAAATAAGQGLAGYGTQQGAGIAQYGTQQGAGISGLAQQIGAQGPQLQQFSADAVNQYMNPYTQNVIDKTMANINRQNGIQQNDLVSRGIMGGNAFGGDRMGVASAELGRNQDMSRDSIIANLLSSGYGQAVSQFNTGNQQALAGQQTALQGMGQGAQIGLGAQQSGAQIGLSGQQAGGQLGLAGAQLGSQGYQSAQQMSLAQQQALSQQQLAAGQQYAGLGSQALGSQLTAAQAQLQSGTIQQQQGQNQLNAQYQQWLQQQAYPFQTTQFLGNTVMGTGAASGGTSQTTSPGPNIGSQVLGLGAMGLGAFLSDERAKENIETVGKTFDGQPIHRFNYKGDPRTQLGLIAQEVEKSHPFAVHDNGGMKMVNYDVATKDAAERGHFAGGGYVAQQSGAPGMFQPIDFTQTGVRGYVPDAGQQAGGRGGVGIPAYPTPPKVDNSISPGMSAGASAIGKGLAGMNSNYGLAGDTINFGGAGSSTPIMGMESAPTINFGMARGGLVGNSDIMQGFADGGMADDDPGLFERFARATHNGRDLARRKFYNETRAGLYNSATAPDEGHTYGGLGSGLNARRASQGYEAQNIQRSVRGYAFGGMPDDPFGEENRAAGLDMLRNGMGTPSPYSIPGGEPSPEPFRLAGPEAMDVWRKGVDRDVALGLTAPEPAGTALAQNAPTPAPRPPGLGAPPLPPQITGPQPQPETAMAYAQPPAGLAQPPAQIAPQQQMAQAQGWTPPARPEPNFGQALMAAGAGMMASRSPTFLGGVGEGAGTGLANYAAQQKQINELDKNPVIDHSGETMKIIYPSTGQIIDTGMPTISAAQKAANERQKEDSARTQKNSDRSYELLKRAQDRLEAKGEAPDGYRLKDGALEFIPGGPADPDMLRKVAEAKRLPGQAMDDETAEFLADRVIAGDTRALVGLGRGAQGAENIAKIQSMAVRKAKEQGVDAKGILRNISEQAYNVSGARTLGTKTVHFGTAEKAMEESLPVARAASAEVPRTQWKMLTELIQKGETQINDPKLKKFLIATDTAAKDYARTINPSGTLRESDIAYARKIISTADNEESYSAALDQLQVEAGVMRRALERQKQEMLSGKSEPGHKSSGAAPAAAASAPGGTPTRVRQNGHTYEKQPDGSYKAID